MPTLSNNIKQKRRRVVFSFEFPDAKEVYLVGDFNEWNLTKHPMKRNTKGLWEKILMLYPGRYEYKFMVDGEWQLNMNNDWKCINCFGTYNNIIKVLQKNI